MPLVIVSGLPCSGKTKFSGILELFINSNFPSFKTVVVNEESLQASKITAYSGPSEEKKYRAAFISAVERSLSKDTVVIADSLNYIKGYRYQLYCLARAGGTTHCCVYSLTSVEAARGRNSGRSNSYSSEAFSELVDRFEEPNNQTKWDSPLFIVDAFTEDQEALEGICGTICSEKVRKPPTFATSSRAADSGDLITSLDRITQGIVDSIMAQLKPFGPSEIVLTGFDEPLVLSKPISGGLLTGLRRQFIHMNRLRPVEPEHIPHLFVNYIKRAL